MNLLTTPLPAATADAIRDLADAIMASGEERLKAAATTGDYRTMALLRAAYTVERNEAAEGLCTRWAQLDDDNARAVLAKVMRLREDAARASEAAGRDKLDVALLIADLYELARDVDPDAVDRNQVLPRAKAYLEGLRVWSD